MPTFYQTTQPGGTQLNAVGYNDYSQTGLTQGRGLIVFAYARWVDGTLDFTSVAFTSGSEATFTPVGTTYQGMLRAFWCPELLAGGTRTIRVSYTGYPGAGFDTGFVALEVTGHDTQNMVPTIQTFANSSVLAITTAYDASGIVAYCTGGNEDGGSSTSPLSYTMWDTTNFYDRLRMFYVGDAGTAAANSQSVTINGTLGGLIIEVKAGGASGSNIIRGVKGMTGGMQNLSGGTQ